MHVFSRVALCAAVCMHMLLFCASNVVHRLKAPMGAQADKASENALWLRWRVLKAALLAAQLALRQKVAHQHYTAELICKRSCDCASIFCM